jgi:Na+-driven multidrug efflux pump
VNSKIDFGNDKIHKIILKLAPPVMIGQLIQALYNIVDSLFIGRYDECGLTALSIIYPLQLLMIALAVGSGVGINSLINHYKGQNQNVKSKEVMGMATPIAIFSWFIFAGITYLLLPVYVKLQTNEQYKGRLISLDGAMNIYLQNSEEIFENNSNEKIKQFKHLFIRGNNGNIYIFIIIF